MNSTSEASHIETRAAGERLVLLGASNLTRAFPELVDLARGALQRPLEIVCAKGHGRSFGQSSRFLAKKFPGILQCRLWQELRALPPRRTLAIVADIGNDLAYNAPVETIVDWIEETLDRLAASRARCAINDLPIDSLRGVGRARYELLRRALFPLCRLSHREMSSRAEQLSGRLGELAQARNIPIFSAEKAWYGWDPIHPRRPLRMEIYRRMLSAVVDESIELKPALSTPAERRRMRRCAAADYSLFGIQRSFQQPTARPFRDVSIRLY